MFHTLIFHYEYNPQKIFSIKITNLKVEWPQAVKTRVLIRQHGKNCQLTFFFNSKKKVWTWEKCFHVCYLQFECLTFCILDHTPVIFPSNFGSLIQKYSCSMPIPFPSICMYRTEHSKMGEQCIGFCTYLEESLIIPSSFWSIWLKNNHAAFLSHFPKLLGVWNWSKVYWILHLPWESPLENNFWYLSYMEPKYCCISTYQRHNKLCTPQIKQHQQIGNIKEQ